MGKLGTHLSVVRASRGAASRFKQTVGSSLQDCWATYGPSGGTDRGLRTAARDRLVAYRNPRMNGRAKAAGGRTRRANTAMAPMVTR